jgi:hypothetical protein
LPDEFFYETIGLPQGDLIQFTVTSDGVMRKTVEAWDCGQCTRTTHSRAITLQAWREFLADVAPLNLHRWREHYDDDDLMDGWGWSLRLSMGSVQVQSGGSNAGPHPQNPARVVYDMDVEGRTGNDVLIDALVELWQKGLSLD